MNNYLASVLPKPVRLPAALLFLAAHACVAVPIRNNETLATIHALGTLAVGLWFAWTRSTARTIYVCAYIAGAEVLWRMSSAGVVWEFGKYASAAILIVALIRSRGPVHWLAISYFALLLPSAFLTMAGQTAAAAEQSISFNLSGPLAIALCLCYFTRVKPHEVAPIRVALAALGPIISIATISVYSTLTATQLAFTRNSNRVTSGDFGPNEVSAVLGMGALFCFFFLFSGRVTAPFQALFATGGLALSAISVMTFSRGGMYMAIGALTAALFCLARDSKARGAMAVAVPVLVLMAAFAIVPSLNRFTEGALGNRFAETQLTGRYEFLKAEMETWLEHPVFGVGPGMSNSVRNRAASHTELTRLLSDHGLFGLISMILLLTISVKNALRGGSKVGQAFSLFLVVWAFLFMLTDALRLVAPAFFIGLSSVPFANWDFGPRPLRRLFRYRSVVSVPASANTGLNLPANI